MEIKEEINQIVETLPEDVLSELLQYLRQIEKESGDKIRLSLTINSILTEDDNSLERLAQ